MIDLSKKKVMVTGGAGFLGRHIVKELQTVGCNDIFVPRFEDYDFRHFRDVTLALEWHRPDIIIHAAAKVGGIALNQSRPAEMFYDNAIMGINLIHGAHLYKVEKFVQIGSVCEYPADASIPTSEKSLWDGYPEITNAPYGVAKRALLTMGQAYRQQYDFNVIHLLPTNLYGPGDNFDLETSHAIPALIKKIVDAKEMKKDFVSIWGRDATRDFLYVEDAARAIVAATQFYEDIEPVNIATGRECRIGLLAELISNLVGYKGQLVFDSTRPTGQKRRKLDIRKAGVFEFQATTDLRTGLIATISWYKENLCEKSH
jgi:GDP-L-fucose synthase